MSEQIFQLLTNDDIQDRFKVSKVTIWRWRRDGLLGYFMIGGKPRYSQEHLARLLANLDKSKPRKKSAA
jgi:predicted site-specific integrase-resolvase